jgi:hypothetical protein
MSSERCVKEESERTDERWLGRTEFRSRDYKRALD